MMKHGSVLVMYCFFFWSIIVCSHKTVNKGQVLVIMMQAIRMVR